MGERTIPDVWKVFGTEKTRQRRNSWQKMITEEEKTITDLFSDIHLHACRKNNEPDHDIYDDEDNKKKTSRKSNKITAEQQHTSNEWHNIEKHLSMKKTIRKKMMRDLKQAFLDSDTEDCNIQIAPGKNGAEPNLLELLKNSETNDAKTEVVKKPGFWAKLAMRAKSKR